jgi:hypothetical protein
MLKKARSYIVVDLDGTIADVSHRVHLAQAKLWDEFNALAPEDGLWGSTMSIIPRLSLAYSCIIVTGREEKWRVQTEQWLKDQGIAPYFNDVLMRPSGNFNPDYQVKIELMEEYFSGKDGVLENVLIALDDRDTVVEAYRNYGLECWQVRQGDY